MQTILFDMDGTLLDTEKWYQKGWRQAAKDCGYELSTEQALTMRSLGKPFDAIHARELFGETVDLEAIRRRRNEIMQPWFDTLEIPVKPYVREAVTYLKEHDYQIAVVTASKIERTEFLLKKAGLFQYFDKIICVSMVERGKPAPDVYQYACQQLGVLPEDTFAVEDSPNGVTSASLSGCKVIMIPDLTQPDAELERLLFAKADNMKELINIVENWRNKNE